MLERKFDEESAEEPLKPLGDVSSENVETRRERVSFAQERMWFLARLKPDDPFYNIPAIVSLNGEIRPQVLERSLNAVIARHESLRTSIETIEGQPAQVIQTEASLSLVLVDLSGMVDPHSAVRTAIQDEVGRPIEIQSSPLLRAVLLKRAEQRYVLLITMHHIIADGVSVGLLLREMASFYRAFVEGKPASLPDLPLQYSEFATKQRERLKGDELRRQLTFWRGILEDAPVLQLPTDRPRPALQTFNGAREPLVLPPELCEELRRVSRRFAVTPFMTFFAAFNVLLSRYSDQTDIVVGVPVAGRDRAEVARLIGNFTNVIVMRTDTSVDPTFGELLRRVRELALSALSHQEIPFEKLVRELQPERDLGRNPFFQVGFAYQNVDLNPIELPDLEVGPPSIPGFTLGEYEVAATRSRVDMEWHLLETSAGTTGNVVYNIDLFEPSTVRAMARHFRNLLQGFVARPDARISEISLLDGEERQELLAVGKGRKLEYPERCFHELLQSAAAREPKAIAAVFESEELSYEEWNQSSNRLARHLDSLGVGREVMVGICLTRSFDMLVALMAVFKAGGVYVPLDPAYPRERLSFIIEDSKCPLVITESSLSSLFDPGSAELVILDRERNAIAGRAETDLPPRVTLDSLAYTIYTSGSTGRPKGVLLQHRGMVNLAASMPHLFDLGSDSRILQFSSLSYDASVWEIVMAVSFGARLVLGPQQKMIPGPELVELIQRQGVDTVTLPPSILAALDPGRLQNLRTVIAAGEACSRELVERWAPGRRFYNAYGPTETTVCASVAELYPGATRVSIGKPNPNFGCHVLDRSQSLVPVGVPGELYVEGAGLARGYWNQPELTSQKFVSTDWAPRLYRTGDLVRRLDSGDIQYLGRIDDQVKVRGFRVELGEVEAVLQQHLAVRQAAVVQREDVPGKPVCVAYVVFVNDVGVSSAELRTFLRDRIPEHMVPSVFVSLDVLPLSPNGKVDRRALPAAEAFDGSDDSFVAPETEAERRIVAIWRDVLQRRRVGIHENFFDVGGHSLLVAQVHARLEKEFHRGLPIVELFQHPTVHQLARRLAPRGSDELPADGPSISRREVRSPTREPIAIVGLHGRFPGARNAEEFWNNLVGGVESISFLTEERLVGAGVPREVLDQPNYVRAAAVIEDAEMFDASFFGFSPREAESIDPQHRVFLECSWELLEIAGYDPQKYGRPIGVFAGMSRNNRVLDQSISGDFFRALMGVANDFLPTRVSYLLNLTGPSVNVHTACSTSMVAVHLAVQSLLSGDCHMALAGGASIRTPQERGYLYEEEGIASPDGHCRAFDADARGTIGGNGVGVVLLKRLEDARADGDTIYAVIKGSAINNDGAIKIGYTAPSVEGQARVIAAAQDMAGVTPESVSYVETHGTGTLLGDPIEIKALVEAFGRSGSQGGRCAIGSVKTNIGHLDAAAGVAGLIKTALSLHYKKIPPSLNFQKPNPQIDFEAGPFYVNVRPASWEPKGPRRAGVSSFGIGGTNTHVVLEEAPAPTPTGPAREYQLLVLSAKTPGALERSSENLRAFLEVRPGDDLADVAFTLKVGRRDFRHRQMVVCKDRSDAVRALKTPRARRADAETRDRPVSFLFTGQGSQYPNMGRDLYRAEPCYREVVDECAAFLKDRFDLDLLTSLFPPDDGQEEAGFRLAQTNLTQPALFVTEYALARLWMSWGIVPRDMIGHSIGEYVAGCVAGVFSLEDALAVVAERGRLMNALPGGSMLAVALPEQEISQWLSPELSLASVNAPDQCVVAGPTVPIEELAARLAAGGLDPRRLRTSHAFHSPMMEPMVAPLAATMGMISLHPPRIPFLSNVSGTWIRDDEATDPAYWATHARRAVRFTDGIGELLTHPDRVLLEVGPGNALGSLARRHPAKREGQVVLSSLRHPTEEVSDVAFLLEKLGSLWLAGIAPDWSVFYSGETRHRVQLPTYPFERREYRFQQARESSRAAEVAPTKKPPLEDWFYVPSWLRSPRVESSSGGIGLQPTLAFVDDHALSKGVADRLQRTGFEFARVRPGHRFERRPGGDFVLNPASSDDYDRLLEALAAEERLPRHVIHLWSAPPPQEGVQDADLQDRGFYSLTLLAKAIAGSGVSLPVHVDVVTSGVHEVTGEETLCPDRATVLGPLRVVPVEHPNFTWRNVDVSVAECAGTDPRLSDALVSELLSPPRQRVVALRRGQRWVETHVKYSLASPTDGPPARLREGGVFLITGGLGAIGLALAGFLAETVGAKLILTSRRGLPPRESWKTVLSDAAEDERVVGQIRAVRAIEEKGGTVQEARVDVSDLEGMRRVVAQAKKRFGAIHGVIHAAGVPGGAILQRQSRDVAARVLAAKVEGTKVLASVLSKEPLDFFLLCSSLSSIVGGVGQIDYCAANAYLDAFARHYRQTRGGFTVSVNWNAWREAGMAVTEMTPDMKDRFATRLERQSLSNAEGIDAFRRILARCDEPQIILSSEDLESFTREMQRDFRDQPEVTVESEALHPRPNVGSEYVEPSTAEEKTLAEAWQRMLGIDRVGSMDNFYELGGDSLLAVQVTSSLEKTSGLVISPGSLVFQTLGQVAASSKRKERSPEAGKPRTLAERLISVVTRRES